MADLTVKAVIEILLRGKGGQEAAETLRQLELEAKKARKALGETGETAKAAAQVEVQAATEAAAAAQAASETVGLSARDAAAVRIAAAKEAAGAGAAAAEESAAAERAASESTATAAREASAVHVQAARLEAEAKGLSAREAAAVQIQASKAAAERVGLSAREAAAVQIAAAQRAAKAEVAAAGADVAANRAADASKSISARDAAAIQIAEAQRVAAAEKQAAKDRAAAEKNAAAAAAGAAEARIATFKRIALGLFGLSSASFLFVKAFRLIREAIVETSNEKRALAALQLQIESLGIKGGPSIDTVRKALVDLEREGGAALADTIPIFQKFVGLTGSTKTALFLTELASRAAEAEPALGGAANAAENLANILQGRAGLAAKSFGVEIREGATRLEVFDAVLRKFPRGAAQIEDTRNAIDRTTASFSALGRTISEKAGPATDTVLQFFSDVAEGARLLIEDFTDLGSAIAQSLKQGKIVKVKIERPEVDLSSVDKDTLSTIEQLQATAKGLEKSSAVRLEIEEKIRALAEKSAAEDKARVAELEKLRAEAATLNTRRGAAVVGADERRLAIAKQIREIERQRADAGLGAPVSPEEEARREFAEKDAKDREQAARKTEIATVKARLEVARDGSEEEIRLRREVIRLEEADAIANIEDTLDTETAIRARFDAERQTAETLHLRKIQTLRDDAEEKALRAEVQNADEGTDRRIDAELRLIEFKRSRAVREAVNPQQVESINAEALAAAEDAEVDHIRKVDALKRKAEENSLRQQLGIAEEGSRERLAIESRLIDLERDERLAAVNITEEEITEIRLAAEIERESLIRRSLEAERDRRIAIERDVADARRDAADAALELEKAQAEVKAPLKVFDIIADQIAQERKAKEIAVQQDLDDDLRRIESKRAAAEESIRLAELEANSRLNAGNESSEALAESEARFARLRADVIAESNTEVIGAEAVAAAARKAIDDRLKAAVIQNEEAKKQARIQASTTAARLAIQSLTTLFGQSKAAAVAEALISAYEAYNVTLASVPAPFNFIIAGLVLAAGLKQVDNIKRTNIGTTGGAAAPTVNVKLPSEQRQGRSASPLGQGPLGKAPATPTGGGLPIKIPGFAGGGEVRRVFGADTGRDSEIIAARRGEIVIEPALSEELRRGTRLAASLGAAGASAVREFVERPTEVLRQIAEGSVQGGSSSESYYDQRDVFNFHGTSIIGRRSDLKDFVREFRRAERRDQARRMR